MKLKIVFLFVVFSVVYSMFFPSIVFLSWEENNIDYIKLQSQFNWLDKDLYLLLLEKSSEHKLNIKFICSVIQHESGGQNVVSKQNKNLSRDYGIMQVNEIHYQRNPQMLLNRIINVRIGTAYLAMCYEKANGDFAKTVRYYNGGPNCSEGAYTNYIYVSKILNTLLLAGL